MTHPTFQKQKKRMNQRLYVPGTHGNPNNPWKNDRLYHPPQKKRGEISPLKTKVSRGGWVRHGRKIAKIVWKKVGWFGITSSITAPAEGAPPIHSKTLRPKLGLHLGVRIGGEICRKTDGISRWAHVVLEIKEKQNTQCFSFEKEKGLL